MGLQFRIRSAKGPGQTFDIKPGIIIGRGAVDVPLNDPKVSGRHAKVELGDDGVWLLTDQGSTNGIRVNKKRVHQVPLTPGLVVRIGNTELEVLSAAAVDESTRVSKIDPVAEDVPPPPPAKERQSNEAATKTATPLENAESLPWDQYLASFSKRAQSKVKNLPVTLLPFDPLLVLTVVRGLQVGTRWVLGYGPRDIGPDALEFHIMDPQSPPLAFRVTPKGEFAFYETEYPKQVKLNGSALTKDTLHDGDEIRIADTIIKVSYKE